MFTDEIIKDPNLAAALLRLSNENHICCAGAPRAEALQHALECWEVVYGHQRWYIVDRADGLIYIMDGIAAHAVYHLPDGIRTAGAAVEWAEGLTEAEAKDE